MEAKNYVFLNTAIIALFGALIVVYIIPEWPKEIETGHALISVLVTFPVAWIGIVIAGWRVSVLSGSSVTMRNGLAVQSVAQFVSLIIPSRLSEIAKPVGLNLVSNLPFSRGFTILAIERVFDAVFLAGLAFAALAVLTGPQRETVQSSGIVLAGIAVTGLLVIGVILVHPRSLWSLADRMPNQWLRVQVEHVAEAISRLASLRTTALVIGLSAASWLAAYLIFALFFFSIGFGELTLGQILVVFIASTLGLIVSVAPGGLGTFEGAIALSLAAFGFPMGTAIAMALLLRLCLVIPVIAVAGWFLVSGDLSLGRLMARLRDWRAENERRK
ncbi:lysylphosphatidylglycerol synthase transmembrane domain-containing protein [uncultured Hoeflea sp.]|uniref:lysylphosphatidylglycerol synthase transmembrane domain-containing protein n=1 Tax=uncultured Hoeflea sp. TaxID=538666 RepID=UPI002603E7AD|nr:lysylphosphatidylglycerol synthase transmembrane domain-containing protein [uncultured Hoeflea sp.]